MSLDELCEPEKSHAFDQRQKKPQGSSLEAKFLDHPQLGRDAWPSIRCGAMGPWGFAMGDPRILYIYI